MRAVVNWLRSLLFVLFMVVTVIPWASAVVLASIFTRGNTIYWMCVGWLRLSIWGAKVICGVKARLHGFERLPDSPVVLLPKHQSTWETFAFPGLMPHPLCYVFKRELLYIPFFGWAMARMDMIHIDRSKRAQAWSRVAAQGKRFMAKGHWVIMFPEGTRAARGGRGTYKSGGTRLAIDCGVPVVPRYFSSLTAIAVTRSVAKSSTEALISRLSASSFETHSGTSPSSRTTQLEFFHTTTLSSDFSESVTVVLVTLTGTVSPLRTAVPARCVTLSTSSGVFSRRSGA